MSEPTKAHTDYSHGNPYSANYNGDVVMMHYTISIAKYDTAAKKIVLADTYSYKKGISVSSIRWGFTNAGAQGGDRNSTRISVTLHDIAGKLIGDIIKLQSMEYWIYFKGPTSLGTPWFGEEAIYRPIREDCKIEFSTTQGFTYTITGVPSITLVGSPLIANKQEFALTGLPEDGITAGSTFKDYLEKHLVARWNSYITEDHIKPNAKIKIVCEGGGGDLMSKTVQVPVKNEKGALDRIESFKVGVGETIPEIVRSLWKTRFEDNSKSLQQSPEGDVGHRPTLEFTFKEWKGKELELHVKFIDNKEEKTVNNVLDICIGSDKNCLGSAYRGQLVGMDFGELYAQMVAASNATRNEPSSVSGRESASQGGNDGSALNKGQDTDKSREGHENKVSWELAVETTKNAHGSWGLIDAVLMAGKTPKFTIDVELPYSYGFTPEVHGGMLGDAIKGSTGAGINTFQGSNLEFYWYVDSDCAELVKQPQVSGKYRVSNVTHTIGLNGNTTQIRLATMNIS